MGRKPKGNRLYAIYYGKKRIFPHDETIEPHGIYEIEIVNSSKYMPEGEILKVKSDLWGTVYIPYAKLSDIWKEWSPYGGRIVP